MQYVYCINMYIVSICIYKDICDIIKRYGECEEYHG